MSYLDSKNYFARWEDPQGNLTFGIRRDGGIAFSDGTYRTSAQDHAFQIMPNDGAIILPSSGNTNQPWNIAEINVIITKSSQAHITCAAPAVGDPFTAGGMDGLYMRIMAQTNQAHVITFPSGSIVGPSGAKTVLTMVPGGATLSAGLFAYNGQWNLFSLSNGTLT